MRNIMFSGNTPGQVVNEQKNMTARHWLQKPPNVGDIVTASTGYKKETRFAKLKILDVYAWDGKRKPSIYKVDFYSTENVLYEIGIREGFSSWDEFYDAYESLNAWDWDNPKRKHWFIEFELICVMIY